MLCLTPSVSVPVLQALVFGVLLAGRPAAVNFPLIPEYAPDPTLVQVNFISEFRGGRDVIEINGSRIADYNPLIIQVFSSAGIVLDNKCHIMTFLGYHWMDVAGRNLRIEITRGAGQKWKGELVGIDQSNGVSVVRLLGGHLQATPVCRNCEIRDGTTVVAPMIGRRGTAQFYEARVLSVGTEQGFPGQNVWVMKMNRPFPDIGLPVLSADRRVIGFVASQDASGFRSVIYPISQLLCSAEKILQKGGDIRTGWLGVYIADSQPSGSRGVAIQDVEPGSPAEKAGLAPGDLLLRYDGQEILNAKQFIRLVENTPIGSRVALEILRGGERINLNSLIEARRLHPAQRRLKLSIPTGFNPGVTAIFAEPKAFNPQPLVGLDTVFLTPPLADALQMPGKTGLLVIDVVKELPADRAGILAGDVIVAMDGQSISDPLSLSEYLHNRDWDKQLELKIFRKGVERTVTIRLSDREP